MRVSKEIAEKAEEYEKAKKREEELYEELNDWAIKNRYEDFRVEGFGVAQEPEGEEQPDGEYCGLTIYGEDSGDGVIYYPIEDSTQYMWVAYCF